MTSQQLNNDVTLTSLVEYRLADGVQLCGPPVQGPEPLNVLGVPPVDAEDLVHLVDSPIDRVVQYARDQQVLHLVAADVQLHFCDDFLHLVEVVDVEVQLG